MIPIVVFFLMLVLVNNNRQLTFYRPWMRKASTAIYVMQFAFIFIGKVVQKFYGINDFCWLLIYFAIILLPTILVVRFDNKKLIEVLF